MWCAAILVVPLKVARAGNRSSSREALLVGAAVGLLSTAIPYSLELEVLRRIEPRVFGVLLVGLEAGRPALRGSVIPANGSPAASCVGIVLVMAASMGASRAGHDFAYCALRRAGNETPPTG